jgi:hypothetical protein
MYAKALSSSLVVLLLALVVASPASAARRHHYAHRTAHYVSGLSEPCGTAARLGGPCGCIASIHFFGHSVRALWGAASWLQFPRSEAAAGTAAIWPNRHHVAAVVDVPGNGTVTIQDTRGMRTVRLAGLTFVRPQQW